MDEWGRDPSVRAMRGIFKTMEDAVDDLLKQLNISPLDHRVRGWLEQALVNYERAWVEARRQGVPMDEKMATAVYGHCLGNHCRTMDILFGRPGSHKLFKFHPLEFYIHFGFF